MRGIDDDVRQQDMIVVVSKSVECRSVWQEKFRRGVDSKRSGK